MSERQFPKNTDRTAFIAAAIAGVAVLAAIYFGSGRLTRFDSPLAAYAAATILAAFAITYRYVSWIQRPATWVYFQAGWRLFLRPGKLVKNMVRLVKLMVDNIILQKFISNRGTNRWVAHMSMAWGCLIAFAITFPLSWGWIQFGVGANGVDYMVEFMGRPMMSFPHDSVLAFLFFNGLNFSAVFVLIGVGMAMHRRLFEHGAQSVETFTNDFMPLFLLFAVSVTGLMITASYRLMGGSHFSFISMLHAFTVIVLLLWMPFGKLFHVIQRPAQLGVAYYKEEGREGDQAVCPRSGEEFQSQMHHDDLVVIMKAVGMDFGAHQDLSPQEKRRLIALNQAAEIDGVPYVG